MSKFKDIDILQYIKLNYLSKNVIHEGKGKIVPFHGAHVELGENSKLVMHDGSLEIGTNKVKGSKAETLIRLRKDATWNVKGYCGLSYGVTVEVNDHAEFNTGYLTVNSNSTIVVNQKINMGNDVMIGRNTVIYDSDFHTLNGEKVSKEVMIGDHVWIATNVTVLKGVHIGEGSVIGAGTIVREDIPDHVIVGSKTKQVILSENAYWER